MLALTGSAIAADTLPAHPMFARRVGLQPNMHAPSQIPTSWDFTWTYNSKKYTAVFLGTDPTKGNATTTIPVELIPVLMKYKTVKENPLKKKKGESVISRIVASPIFDSTTDYKQGSTDLGATQYEDAFMRGQTWGYGVSADSSYHVLLGTPTVEPKITLNATSQGTEFGVSVLLYSIGAFDNAIQATVKKYPVNSLPMFVTTQTYLTTGNECCIGGYHNFNGTQAYGMFTYIQATGVFSQDVSALSHEVGEWLDDPLTTNNVECGIYEVGDPLEGGQNGHPYGTWPYTVNGFTYHLQDLVLPPYFGAPTSTAMPAPYDFTFQGYTGLGVCSNGG